MRSPEPAQKTLPARRPAAGNKAHTGAAGLRRAFRALLSSWGPQGWWPLFGGGPLPVYRPGDYAAPGPAGAFEICAGALLTQNTAWRGAEKALAGLKEAGLLSPRAAASAPLYRLEKAVRPAGFFRQKAARLKKFAAYSLSSGLLGRLRSGPAEALRRELLSLKGVGPETADSILLYAGGRPFFPADAYSLRVFGRLGLLGKGSGYAEAASLATAALGRDAAALNELHALTVKLCKEACLKRSPHCGLCPLDRLCPKETL